MEEHQEPGKQRKQTLPLSRRQRRETIPSPPPQSPTITATIEAIMLTQIDENLGKKDLR